MKFKDTVKILTEQNTVKEIKGTVIPFKDGIVNLNLLAHMSDNAWTPNTVEVSEQSTGCRLFSMTKDIKDIKPSDVVEETTKFILTKGKKPFMEKVNEKRKYVKSLGLDIQFNS